MSQFNLTAQENGVQTAVDLVHVATELFDADEGELHCVFIVRLNNGRKQRFRTLLEKNSMGDYYVRFQPQGRPY
ncbi:hypothetical protein [Microvirga massiliensis]|uniref:hypothetical protein n=1 Tax=Microvirga massiliensis TaxID=1033741 RepID=UPI00062BC921|nr:hypothetical protein [Microvirga massiliensis]